MNITNNMKKTIAIAAVILILCFVLYMLWHIVENKSIQEVEIEKLTQIELIDLKGNSAVIFHSNKTIIVLYFKTNCQFCLDEINSIAENIETFSNIELFLVSSESQERIAEFASNFEIDKQYFFHDKTGNLKQELNVKSYPAIFIFSKEKELITQFKGAVPIVNIISGIPNE